MIGLLYAAVAWLAWREARRTVSPAQKTILGAEADGGLVIGSIGHNLSISEVLEIIPTRALIPYFVARYPKPPQASGWALMPVVEGETATQPVDMVIDVSNFRLLPVSEVPKTDGWLTYNWSYRGQVITGWRAHIHPKDYALAEKASLIGDQN